MDKLKLLIVEGNTKEENLNFNKAGCVSQSENFTIHIQKLEPNCEIDIVQPGDDSSIAKIFSSLNNFQKFSPIFHAVSIVLSLEMDMKKEMVDLMM